MSAGATSGRLRREASTRDRCSGAPISSAGTGFMVDGALACSVSRRGLLVRLRPEDQDDALAQPGVEPMVMGGRSSRGWVHVSPDVLGSDEALRDWVEIGVAAARASN